MLETHPDLCCCCCGACCWKCPGAGGFIGVDAGVATGVLVGAGGGVRTKRCGFTGVVGTDMDMAGAGDSGMDLMTKSVSLSMLWRTLSMSNSSGSFTSTKSTRDGTADFVPKNPRRSVLITEPNVGL